MSRLKYKNLIYNSEGIKFTDDFYGIKIPDNIILARDIKGNLFSYRSDLEKEKLYLGKSNATTDSWIKKIPSLMESFKNNTIYFYNTKDLIYSIEDALKFINKIEYLFPVGTELIIQNKRYGRNKEDKIYSLDVKYITDRKFIGFRDNFGCSKKSFKDILPYNDDITNQFIKFLRNNNFLVEIIKEEADLQYNIEESYTVIGYGYNLRIGFAAFNNEVFGYSNGIGNILYDHKEYFNKWSQAEEMKKPATTEEFESILNKLIAFSNEKELELVNDLKV